MNVDVQSSQGEADPPQGERVSFSLIDQSLWANFSGAESPEAFVAAWLGLQCRQIPGAHHAVAVLGAPDTGPFEPVATIPSGDTPGRALMRAAEAAMADRRGVLMPAPPADTVIAHPVVVDGSLYGTVALAVSRGAVAEGEAMRRLRWGAGWLEALLRREQGARDAAVRDRTQQALTFLATVLTARRFDDAAMALVTELARELACDPVSLGIRRRRRVHAAAVSHASSFASRMNLMQGLGRAMDEAVDQEDIVLYPPPAHWDYRITRMHEELALAHQAGSVLTVPIQAKGAVIGAMTLERPASAPFDDETVELVDAVASMVGPVLAEMRRNDRPIVLKVAEAVGGLLARLFGPRHLGVKLATVAVAILAYLALTVTGEFTVGGPARVEGAVQRTVTAPFAGYVATQTVRAGETVREGELIATLDDQDLNLERLRWTTARGQREVEYDRALAERNRAQAAIIKSQIAQAEAQLALIEEQIARTRITAPFDGIVVSGDLSQSVGAAVERGEELFRIAPLDAYRVVIEVDEGDVAEVEPGQTGHLVLAARPGEALGYTVDMVTPVAESHDGRNAYRVEASLRDDADWLRPGMEGAARTDVDERLLVVIWTRRLVNWARLTLWQYAP